MSWRSFLALACLACLSAVGRSGLVSLEAFLEAHSLAIDDIAEELIRTSPQVPRHVSFSQNASRDVHIGLSGVAGIGLFASRSFSDGEAVFQGEPCAFVVDYRGPPIPFTTSCCGNGSFSPGSHSDSFGTSLGDVHEVAFGIDAFLNHDGAQPNCVPEPVLVVGDGDEPGTARPAVLGLLSVTRALRQINASEELVYDYRQFRDERVGINEYFPSWIHGNE